MREQSQRIGVDDRAPVAAERRLEHLPRPVVLPEARTERDDIGVLDQIRQFLRLAYAAAHELRARADDRGNVLVASRDSHESGARSQRRLAGHACRAGHADVAADDEHAALLTFVSRAPAPR